MTCAVAMVTVRMQGISDAARLDAAAKEIASFDALARTQALADGIPRLLTFSKNRSAVEMRHLELDAADMAWSSPHKLHWASGVSIEQCLLPGVRTTPVDGHDEKLCSMEVRGNGISTDYALLLSAGELKQVLVIDGNTGIARLREVSADGSQELTDSIVDWNPCDAEQYEIEAVTAR